MYVYNSDKVLIIEKKKSFIILPIIHAYKNSSDKLLFVYYSFPNQWLFRHLDTISSSKLIITS